MTNTSETPSDLATAQSPDEKSLRRIRALQNSKRKSLRGASPTARANKKRRDVLTWIYRFGYASPTTIEHLAGTVRSGYSSALEKRGLLRKVRTESGGGVAGIPNYICLLTPLGVELATKDVSFILPYDCDPSKINQQLLRHNEIVQTLTLMNMKRGDIEGFLTENEIRERSRHNEKEPDVVWIERDNRHIGVEVELTPKSGRRLDEFVRAIWLSVLPNSKWQYRFAEVRVYTDSAAIERNYSEVFAQPYFPAPYRKDSRNYWRQVEDEDQDRGDGGEGFIQPQFRGFVKVLRI